MKGKQPSTRHRSAFVACQIGYKSFYIHGIPVPKVQEKHSLLGRVLSRGVSVKNSTILYLFCQNFSGEDQNLPPISPKFINLQLRNTYTYTTVSPRYPGEKMQ